MADAGFDLITLPEFLTGCAAELQSDPVRTLQDACNLGLGHWLRPDPVTSAASSIHRRPATHLHEITLLGVNATGDTERAAAAHWLTVARRLLDAQSRPVCSSGVAA